jgi:anti-sigma factor RsiW
MTDRHLDEGIIQAYIDGELSHAQTGATAAHLAACEACSVALAEAEGETGFFASAFAPDDSVNVPTAALRSRLNAAVAQLEALTVSEQRHSQGRNFGSFLASLSGLFTFTPRAAAAFATLLLAVAVGIIYLSSQKARPTPATGPEVVSTNETPAPSPVATRTNEGDAPVSVPDPVKVDTPAYVAAGYGKRSGKRPQATATLKAPKEEVVPGEKAYQTAIASLEKTIKLGGDESLRPALRADYERNIAVLDSAIKQTRQVAAQNPKDKDAVGFLLAAYQSKVELLTRVADQAQVAALGR